MIKTLLFSLMTICTLSAFGQSPAALQQEKMKGLQFFAGSWKGEGWMIMHDGKKHHFDQTEVVQPKFNGGVLMIEGFGTDQETKKPIHDALAYLTYDVLKQQYRFTAMTGMGYMTDTAPEVKDNVGYTWSMDNPRYMVKFSLTLDQGDWFEIGEISTDKGVTWIKNFEMRLKKVN